MPIVNNINELCVQENRRVIGIDYGDKRIGIAVSDRTLQIASPLVILDSNQVFDKMFKIIDEYDVFLVVVGDPKAMCGGDSGKQLEKVHKFIDKMLSIRDVDVIFWDERLSTSAAMRYINNANLSRDKQKKIRDKVAASFILQGVLDALVYRQ